MSWCDKLGSTPAVGFKFDPHFAPLDILLDSVSPILDKEIENDRIKFTIDRQDRFQATFSTFDGFNYTFDQSKISVAFNHRFQVQRASAGPPRIRILTEPKAYTELMDIVMERTIAASLMLPKIGTRKVHRIGIMTVSAVENEEIPPGVQALLSYWKKPWEDKVSAFTLQMTVTLDRTDHWEDRCIHTIARQEEQDDELITLQFDWQRSFKAGRSAARSSLEEIGKRGKIAALEYFERLAEGSGFDARIFYGRTD